MVFGLAPVPHRAVARPNLLPPPAHLLNLAQQVGVPLVYLLLLPHVFLFAVGAYLAAQKLVEGKSLPADRAPLEVEHVFHKDRNDFRLFLEKTAILLAFVLGAYSRRCLPESAVGLSAEEGFEEELHLRAEHGHNGLKILVHAVVVEIASADLEFEEKLIDPE